MRRNPGPPAPVHDGGTGRRRLAKPIGTAVGQAARPPKPIELVSNSSRRMPPGSATRQSASTLLLGRRGVFDQPDAAHLAIGQRLHGEAGQDVKLSPPVNAIAVNRLAPVATRGGVVDRTGEFGAQQAGHGRSLADLRYSGDLAQYSQYSVLYLVLGVSSHFAMPQICRARNA